MCKNTHSNCTHDRAANKPNTYYNTMGKSIVVYLCRGGTTVDSCKERDCVTLTLVQERDSGRLCQEGTAVDWCRGTLQQNCAGRGTTVCSYSCRERLRFAVDSCSWGDSGTLTPVGRETTVCSCRGRDQGSLTPVRGRQPYAHPGESYPVGKRNKALPTTPCRRHIIT